MKKNQPVTSLKTLSDPELRQEVTRRKTLYVVYIVLILTMVCVAIYNATHKGSLIFSAMPLIFMPLFITIMKNYKDAKAELDSRQPR